ncbi:MAG: hypothetical protein IBX50_13935 [Marinospirillum sp.]|uniref:hypothetical protein n=1 Tax=Marinospirillum sp. TaxID=2183934 RepID=UPI0019DDA1B3|nr:hypothetical protein [Marinospirillum sp.]MBE0507787.1 hypothetical protein [Marinospirillum sp.]
MFGAAMTSLTGGGGLSGGAAGDATATSTNTNDISTGVGGIGGFAVGDYYSRGAQVAQASSGNTLLIAGVVIVVAFLWLRKK